MIRAAVESDPFFVVDPIETRRGGISYTFDTASSLLDAGEAAPISWLIGTDLLPTLHTWYRFDDLMNIVTFVVMQRPGQTTTFENPDPRVPAICSQVVEVPQIEVSSTLIRSRVAAGKSIAGLVHPAVEKLIRNHKLYEPG